MSWFSKKPSIQRREDIIWKTAELKLDRLAADVSSAHHEGAGVLVLYHFKNTRDQLRKRLGESALTEFSSESDFGRWREGYYSTVCLAPVSYLPAEFNNVFTAALITVKIFVAEHHPLAEPDSRILAWVKPLVGEICFYESLDAPMFAKLNIAPLLDQLGFKVQESLSHHFITKAIAGMQEKVAKKIQMQNFDADSAEIWWKQAFPADQVL